ncbi:MAG: hypothetical protein FJ276_37690 [Planctomycetes bacterium]|nr:hypothetical protein [Planctomycetota bacterium]
MMNRGIKTTRILVLLAGLTLGGLSSAVAKDKRNDTKPSPAQAASRTWTDASGKFKVEAVLLNVNGDNVVLKKKNGNTTTVPISKLSKPDQDFLASLN